MNKFSPVTLVIALVFFAGAFFVGRTVMSSNPTSQDILVHPVTNADAEENPLKVPVGTTAPAEASAPVVHDYKKPSDEELSKKLTPLQYHVTQHAGTEPPFKNEFWDNHEAGLYVDIVTGEPLFSSTDKFNSGTGWPSFTKPVNSENVKSITDDTHGMVRTEVRSKTGNSHLGHVFDDGPQPLGTRFCINSASLRFIPAEKLDTEGYGLYRKLFTGAAVTMLTATNNSCAVPKKGQGPGCEASVDVAIVSGGCFWGMQDLLRKIPGVITTEVGYTGGSGASPTYPIVHSGTTGHAEAVKIIFDTTKLSYADLLEKWFFKMHDPTTLNRQGNDIGTQYRSAIFYSSEAQKMIAEEVKERAGKSGHWQSPIVTEIVKAGEFTPAEGYHQDYLKRNPGGYTCHFLREWKDEK